MARLAVGAPRPRLAIMHALLASAHDVAATCPPQKCDMTCVRCPSNAESNPSATPHYRPKFDSLHNRHMYPRYEPVPMGGSDGPGRLYRYFDQRVPPTASGQTSAVVLFVPGHAGHHEQVRSIGSEAMLAASARDLAIDFYTLSDGETLTAFDGSLLSGQARRVEAALATLTKRYSHAPTAGFYIVAHSMAGVATLEAVRRLAAAPSATDSARSGGDSSGSDSAESRQTLPPPPPLPIDAILLLGAPMQRPVIGCSASLSRLHFRLRHSLRNLTADNAGDGDTDGAGSALLASLPALGSITGGCADWMVPSHLSSLAGVVPPEALAFSASTLSIPGVRSTVDHNALLWCNQVREWETVLTWPDTT